jgi:hypothetical protein
VWKITILRQKIFFFPILGGRAPGAPPGSAPDIYDTRRVIHMVKFVESLVGDRRKKTEKGKISMDIWDMDIS